MQACAVPNTYKLKYATINIGYTLIKQYLENETKIFDHIFQTNSLCFYLLQANVFKTEIILKNI